MGTSTRWRCGPDGASAWSRERSRPAISCARSLTKPKESFAGWHSNTYAAAVEREAKLSELRDRDACIIFDCDGVLVDSEHIKSDAVARHLAELGISTSGPALLEQFSGVPAAEMFRVLAVETGVSIPPSHVEEAQAIKLARCAAVGDALAMPGVHECLAMLGGAAVCVASSSSPTMLEGLLKQARLWDRFAPHIFSVAEVTRGKPAPDLFLFAARRMRVAPEKCVVIEDSVAGVEAAKAAAMIAIGFAGGSHCRPDHAARLYAAGARKVFMNMESLSEYLSTVFDRNQSAEKIMLQEKVRA